MCSQLITVIDLKLITITKHDHVSPSPSLHLVLLSNRLNGLVLCILFTQRGVISASWSKNTRSDLGHNYVVSRELISHQIKNPFKGSMTKTHIYFCSMSLNWYLTFQLEKHLQTFFFMLKGVSLFSCLVISQESFQFLCPHLTSDYKVYLVVFFCNFFLF